MKTKLVLCHPFPLSGRAFADDVEALRDVADVLTPTLSDAAPTIDGMADHVAALLDAKGWTGEPVVVGGISMGGYVALAFARRHASRLGGLILADTRAEPDSPEARANRDAAIDQIEGGGLTTFVDGMLDRLLGARTRATKADVVERVRALALSSSPASVTNALRALRDRADARPSLSAITVPTLVIVGSDDVLTPPPVAQSLASAIAGAKLVEIPNAGHLVNLESPTAFQTAVRGFLNR